MIFLYYKRVEMKQYIVILTFYTSILIGFEKISYQFSHDAIDIVIPCHSKDIPTLNRTIDSIRNNISGIRRVIVVSSEPYTDKAEWFDEALFPFTKEKIALEIYKTKDIADMELHKPKTRLGWLFQQFIKLYAPFCIPGISSNVLLVDADVIFLKKIQVLQKNGAGLYAVSTEYHVPYFTHASKILPELKKVHRNFSGITHHMLFQKEILVDLFNHIYAYHGEEPWVIMARHVAMDSDNRIIGSGMSEYEIYFNFAFSRTNQVKIRHLKWANCKEYEINQYRRRGYDFVAVHNWIS